MNIKLIVGLGNPGQEYQDTRHNAGFWFLDELAWQYKATFKNEKKFFGEIARISLPHQDLWLLKPETFMNLSGKAVAALAQFYKIQVDEILVVHDELDIDCGRIRFKQGGGNGGHNGLKDIQAKLGSANFYRLRLGIGHPGDKNLVTSFVLNKPTANERQLLDNAIVHARQAINLILDGNKEETIRFLHSYTA
ncbi:MAG: aminoacyl-tRNA hydrolase [Neisseriaceae bacterium]|nr:aminoacyl-tRNA hydrolase [Neisseriaceae bacterium]